MFEFWLCFFQQNTTQHYSLYFYTHLNFSCYIVKHCILTCLSANAYTFELPCMNSPCANSGTYKAVKQDYECTTASGFVGRECQGIRCL